MSLNKKIKRILIILTLILASITIYKITTTYGLLESKTESKLIAPIGKWNITLDKDDITNGTVQEVVIENFAMDANSNVKEGKIAPGVSGNLEFTIDPTNTDVSVRYDIVFEKINEKQLTISKIEVIEGSSVLIKTAENTFSGVLKLSPETQKVDPVKLKISFLWENDELNNESDTLIGTNLGFNFKVPMTFKASQYLGEELVEFVDKQA